MNSLTLCFFILFFSGAASATASPFFKVSSTYKNTSKTSSTNVKMEGVATYVRDDSTDPARHLLITVAHVVSGEKLAATPYGSTTPIEVKLIGVDNMTDTATLEITAPMNGASPFFTYRNGAINFPQKALQPPQGFSFVPADSHSYLVSPDKFGIQKGLDKSVSNQLTKLTELPTRRPVKNIKKSFLAKETHGRFKIRHLSIRPGVSGSLLLKYNDEGSLIPYGLAAQYDHFMSRSYFSPFRAIQRLIEKTHRQEVPAKTATWKMKDCKLYRHYTERGYNERIFPPAGGFSGGDGGGFSGGDSGGFSGGDGGSNDCASQKPPNKEKLERALNSYPGLEKGENSNQRIVSFNQTIEFETFDDGQRGNVQDTFSYLADPYSIHFLSEEGGRVDEIPLSRLNLAELLENKKSSSFSFLSAGDGLVFTRNHVRYMCGEKSIDRINEDETSSITYLQDQKKVHFKLLLNGCSSQREFLTFTIDLDKFVPGQRKDSQMKAKNWLVLRTPSQVYDSSRGVFRNSGKSYLVDLRNFWFSHPNDPLQHSTIQIRPESEQNRWWAFFSFVLFER